ncbi:MAG: DUF4350 domain-containing protein [Gemmatimonadota bacterium]|nr:DUF4350 domain-containing protein [Gemmatimonadota bacterium]MDE2863705.1 DUF4350 domain-containing protein [Gemmatimonadota bacterium]MXV95364.1 DUF4350 domain-containing protein [Gemmatimonadota bacterium]MYB05056.1 DUF4350 domain-containing protein [Gemmatimonadota bacterium]MYE16573.1 DUF4350 domain-containing protein [Gemmatimonadota bacterium]
MNGSAATRRRLRTRPLFWVALILLVALVAGYLGRPEGQRAGNTLRSYFRTTPDGVAALARGIDRLGRHTEPWTAPFVDADALRGTIVLLDARRSPSPREIRALLNHVRSGGTLLYVPRYGTSRGRTLQTALMDSLDVVFRFRTTREQALDQYLREPRWAEDPITDGLALPSRLVRAFRIGYRGADGAGEGGRDSAAVRDSTAAGNRPPAGHVDAPGVKPLLTATAVDSTAWMAAAELRKGSGRVVILAEAGPLSNARAANHPVAVLAVRTALSYTNAADTVFFAEYHQGIRGYRSRAEVLGQFFARTPQGRALLHLILLCFLVLACVGVRFGAPAPAVAPPDRERRSPLEHVSALGDLYRKAGATRTTALLLLARLARVTRHPPPRDTAEADELLSRLDAEQGSETPLARARQGLHEDPPDLAAIAAGIDEHLSRRFHS